MATQCYGAPWNRLVRVWSMIHQPLLRGIDRYPCHDKTLYIRRWTATLTKYTWKRKERNAAWIQCSDRHGQKNVDPIWSYNGIKYFPTLEALPNNSWENMTGPQNSWCLSIHASLVSEGAPNQRYDNRNLIISECIKSLSIDSRSYEG